MATFRITVNEHHKRLDNRYRVSIRLTHNRTVKYIPTDVYVMREQIAKDFSTLRDDFVRRKVDRQIEKYEDILLTKFGSDLSSFTAGQLKNYLIEYTKTEGGTRIDFVKFSRDYIAEKRTEDVSSYYPSTLETALRQLIDFCGRETVFIKEINSNFLREFEKFLRKDRTITRISQLGKAVTVEHSGVSDNTIVEYMTKLRVLFNACRRHYNGDDDERQLIAHNPFKNYRMPPLRETKKRNLQVEDIRKIFSAPGVEGKRERILFGRDLFLICFGLVGINTTDLYYMEYESFRNGRLTYKRKKTKKRRIDQALISVKIEPEIEPLITKYLDPDKKKLFRFYKMYSTPRTFNRAINIGLAEMAKKLGLPSNLSTYYSRHSWATIARNKCAISKNDVSECGETGLY